MHPGVKYARRKEVADLVSSQVLQKTLDELRNITRIDLCVTNTDGVLLVTTFPETAIDAESIRSFVLSAADSQIVQEYHYFKVYDNQNVEYILISKGSSDDAYVHFDEDVWDLFQAMCPMCQCDWHIRHDIPFDDEDELAA